MAKHIETRISNIRKTLMRAEDRAKVGHPAQAEALRSEARKDAAAAFDQLRNMKRELRETLAAFGAAEG